MARDNITVIKPEIDRSASIEVATVTATTVNQANGICVVDAFDNKNNSLQITVTNTASSASTVTFVAGGHYPNSCLGDLTATVDASTTTVIMIQDLSRFEDKDGNLNIDFGTGFTGSIYAVAKRAGLEPVA